MLPARKTVSKITSSHSSYKLGLNGEKINSMETLEYFEKLK